MLYKFVIFCLLLTGCASTPNCDDAKVSMCRAQVECGKGSIGFVFASFTPAGRDQYNRCVQQNLSAQKASAGIESRNVSCESKASDGKMLTDCNSY